MMGHAWLKHREALLAVVIILMIGAIGSRAPSFVSPGNLVEMFNDTAILIILALGQMMVLLTKGIDLSMAANLALTGMIVALLNAHYPGIPVVKGIDIGSKAAVHQFMSELVSQGLAVIMVSSELPEVMGMADRIIVMHEGLMVAEYRAGEATAETIVSAASGIGQEAA
ncbi:L-rhamnose ABC transporter, transmembrane component 2 [Klebsiella pneumoniae]|nr:L-rhamnose ABC transporter, transmembrane component 2 [Klebsiella pneumoniae]